MTKAVVLFAICALLVAVVFAGPREDDERDERTLTKGNVGPNGAYYDSKRKSGKLQDKFRFNIKFPGDDVQVEMSHFSKADGDAVNNKFRIRFVGLQEFNDTNNNNVIDADETKKPIVKFAGMSCSDYAATPGTTEIQNFLCENGAKTLQVKGHISTASVTIGNVTVPSNGAKFDLIVKDFDYKLVGPDVKLALIARTKSKQQMKTRGDSSTSPTKVAFGADAAPSAFFEWVPTVFTNAAKTAQADVVASPKDPDCSSTDTDDTVAKEDGEGCKAVEYVFKVARPSYVEWDPTVNIYSDSSSALANAAVSFVTLLLVVLCALLL